MNGLGGGDAVRVLAVAAGVVCLLTVLLDAFQTIILPRRATGRFRLTSVFYLLTWRPWRWLAGKLRDRQKRETVFSFYGPMSLLVLLMIWAGSMMIGFALIFYSLGSPWHDAERRSDFQSDLYVSGTTIFTLGLGDVTPLGVWPRAFVILESGTGLGFLAIVMGYFPVLYAAFSRREVRIALLDARAGSPPTAAELMRRHAYPGAEQALSLLLVDWELWSAELLESHISYPQLCYFRSQHTNQSWLSALTAILDTSALLIAGVGGHEARQAQLTFAMARHAIVDLAQIFFLRPVTGAPDRLPAERYDELYNLLGQKGIKVCRDNGSMERLGDMRALYEGYAHALSDYLAMPLPPWIATEPQKDNWLRVAKLRDRTEAAEADAGPVRGGMLEDAAAPIDRQHDF
jgi:Ion channel